MNLDILPVRTGGAAENMALDYLLLQRYPAATAPRFRHYAWRAPAFTFGYAQKIAFVREHVPSEGPVDLCRRPTGGGIVDHREDWTYALVIPRGHPLEELRATQSYRAVHEALADALRAQGVPAILKLSAEVRGTPLPVVGGGSGMGILPKSGDFPQAPGRDARATSEPQPPPTTGRCVPDGVAPALLSAAVGPGPAAALSGEAVPGVCFQRAEVFDVVHAGSGEKIAGAAQKRNKHGLLFQGSVWRPAAGSAALDWDRFEEDFGVRLGAALGGEAQKMPWPELNEEEVGGLTEQYSSPEWIEHR